MFGFGKKSTEDDDDFTRGYEAAKEFLDLLDHDVSEADMNTHWDAVESGHSREYVEGYAGRFLEEPAPWWKIW